MDSLFDFICNNADYAHLIIFAIFLVSGFGLPISEEILLIGGGVIANTCAPDHALKIYLWCFLGSYLAAWEVYGIGRYLGPYLNNFSFFKFFITPEKLDRLTAFYAKHGVWTFIIGRFCPGGIRNTLFLSSGLTKMPFYLFIARDGIACLISTFVFFQIGYQFKEHFDSILFYFKKYNQFIFSIFGVLLAGFFVYLWSVYRKKQ